jgi:hypothetical protein
LSGSPLVGKTKRGKTHELIIQMHGEAVTWIDQLKPETLFGRERSSLLGLVLRSNNKRQCVSDVTLHTIMKHMLMIILGNCSRWRGCSSTFVLGNLFQRDKELNDKRRNRGFRGCIWFDEYRIVRFAEHRIV